MTILSSSAILIAMKSFIELGISPRFLPLLEQRGIKAPTDIQAEAIQPILEGQDVRFRSATGTGKTLAYLLPLLSRLETAERRTASLVIIAPTSELCAQIRKEAAWLAEACSPPLRAALISGGANMTRQIDQLRQKRPEIIVGTAMRLSQLERMGKLKLTNATTLVLDEADRLCSVELLDSTRALAERMPRERQTIACSATLGPRAEALLAAMMKPSCLPIRCDDASILKNNIQHWAFFSERRKKIAQLRGFLRTPLEGKVLVFTAESGQVENIVSQLVHHGFMASGLFGDMDKVGRKKALDDFRSGRSKVLVTSDLAARGLDIPEVGYIVAFDVPEDDDIYAHRAGRTARAGGTGVMATFGDERELSRLAALEKRMGLTIYPKLLYSGSILAPNDPDAAAAEAAGGKAPNA